MSNIKGFEYCMSEVLTMLYENFPVPINVNVRELKPGLKDDFSDEGNETVDVFRHTIHFLKRESYIVTYDKEVKESHIFREAVLTSKGFAALNLVPKSLNENKTILEQLEQLKNKSVAIMGTASAAAIFRAFFTGT